MDNDKVQKMKESMELPLIMAPMFLVSSPEMVINGCLKGVVGTFPALNARTATILENWMQEINETLDAAKKENPEKKIAPWGINYLVHSSNKRYKEDLKLIAKHKPPIIITALGDPGPVVEVAKEYGGIVLSDVINTKFAKKAIEKGADGLILVGSGAGGHAGELNPISFINEVRQFFDGPLVLSGGMTEGKDILAGEILGADFVYMGTRFIPSVESFAQDEYKKMIVDSSIEDIIYTDAFSGVNANYLIPSILKAGLNPDNLQEKKDVDFSNMRNESVKAWKDIWGAGHGIGSIKEIQSVTEIIDELKESYNQKKKSFFVSNVKV